MGQIWLPIAIPTSFRNGLPKSKTLTSNEHRIKRRSDFPAGSPMSTLFSSLVFQVIWMVSSGEQRLGFAAKCLCSLWLNLSDFHNFFQLSLRSCLANTSLMHFNKLANHSAEACFDELTGPKTDHNGLPAVCRYCFHNYGPGTNILRRFWLLSRGNVYSKEKKKTAHKIITWRTIKERKLLNGKNATDFRSLRWMGSHWCYLSKPPLSRSSVTSTSIALASPKLSKSIRILWVEWNDIRSEFRHVCQKVQHFSMSKMVTSAPILECKISCLRILMSSLVTKSPA